MPPADVYRELTRVRPPLQNRSRRAQRAALDAFESLLTERPLSKVTMQDIADRADLSITSVYARFDGKDALVLALHERVIGEAVAQLDDLSAEDASDQGAVEEAVTTLVDGLLAFAHAHAHVFRAVLVAGDDETNQRAAAFIRAGSERVARWLTPQLDVPRSTAERDIDFAWRATVAVVQQEWALDGVDPSRFPLSSAELSARLAQQFLAAIGHPSGPS
ncbi:MAG: TetR/AcrR family transcriptional regulator [Acidimicrobiales bacterium]